MICCSICCDCASCRAAHWASASALAESAWACCQSQPGDGSDAGTNPEQLFAVGFAACFEGALGLVGRREKVDLGDVSIESGVSLIPNPATKGFDLGVSLDVTLPGVQDTDHAVAIVAAAHQVCPYSNATRGNVEVALTANGQTVS